MASEANPPSEPSESSRAIIPFDGPATGTAEVPGSKSLTNRALVCAMLSSPKTKITLTGALRSDDTEAMIKAARKLSADEADVTADEGTTITLRGIHDKPAEITAVQYLLSNRVESIGIIADAAGTVARFMLPVTAAREQTFSLYANDQLRTRPIRELVEALKVLGAHFWGDTNGGDSYEYPLLFRGGKLSGEPITISASKTSQFLSGLLLAAPSFPKGLDISLSDLETAVSLPYIEMTIKIMKAFKAKVSPPAAGQPGPYVVEPGGYLPDQPDTFTYHIEPDATAAGYFWAAAAITGGEVRTEGLTFDSLQGDVRFAKVLEEMGCQVTEEANAITVKGPEDLSQLKGGEFDLRDISDNTQTLAAVAAFASEPVTITGVGFIRKKESDRVGLTAAELRKRGVNATELLDGIRIVPVPNPAKIKPGSIATHNDHRMAMSMSLLGLKAGGIKIEDPACVNKTFPNFFQALEKLRP